jgi:hypothetical protein
MDSRSRTMLFDARDSYKRGFQLGPLAGTVEQ